MQVAEFLRFVFVNLGDVDETVQRVDGVLVIDAKAIFGWTCSDGGKTGSR